MDYKNGKIYKIVSDLTDKIYIGSTTQPLYKRHFCHINKTKTGRGLYTSSELIKLGETRIELIELYPCETREQLNAREGYYIRLNKDICVNVRIEGRTWQEYAQANKAKIAETKKQYREANKAERAVKAKQYYEANKAERTVKDKQYREAHKAEIAKYREANKAKQAEISKKWYEANKDKQAERMKQYAEANKAKIAEYNKQYHQKKKILKQAQTADIQDPALPNDPLP